MLNHYNRVEYQSSAVTSFDTARIFRLFPEIGKLLMSCSCALDLQQITGYSSNTAMGLNDMHQSSM